LTRSSVYCILTKSGSASTTVALDPQPNPNDIVTLHRYYTHLVASAAYRRRVTWATLPTASSQSQSLAVIEYIGKFPRRAAHGNAQKPAPDNYVRTTVASLEKVGELVASIRPTDVYAAVTNTDDPYAVRSRHQVTQKKYYDRNKGANAAAISTNFSDQVQYIESETCRSNYIRAVAHLGGRVPAVLLYTDQQLADIRQFCIEADDRTVLCIDKTYNLGDLYATVCVYKCLRVLSRRTNAPPIFIGPIMLHGQSDSQQFHFFVSHLAGQLMKSDLTQLIVGTDDEHALRAGVKSALPRSQTVICTRHLKNNVTDYMRDKVQLLVTHLNANLAVRSTE